MIENNPILSVVIPTMGRPILAQTLNSLISVERFSETEVIVAGHISDENTFQVVKSLVDQYPNIKYLDIQFETGDSSRKKNEGAAVAQADIIAFLDDDVRVAPSWAVEILKPFKNEKVGLISGPSLVPDDINLVGRLAGLALSSAATGYVSYRYSVKHADVRPVNWSKIIGCNMAYRKSAFEDMGGFDPTFWPGEEMLASYQTQQLQYRLMFNPKAWVYHYPRQSLLRFWRQMYGYGATRTRLIRMGVEFEFPAVIPALWVFVTLVLGVVAAFFKPFLYLLALDLASYLVMDLLITLDMVHRTKKLRDLLLFFIIPFMHISYGLAEWAELFLPDKDLSETA